MSVVRVVTEESFLVASLPVPYFGLVLRSTRRRKASKAAFRAAKGRLDLFGAGAAAEASAAGPKNSRRRCRRPMLQSDKVDVGGAAADAASGIITIPGPEAAETTRASWMSSSSEPGLVSQDLKKENTYF